VRANRGRSSKGGSWFGGCGVCVCVCMTEQAVTRFLCSTRQCVPNFTRSLVGSAAWWLVHRPGPGTVEGHSNRLHQRAGASLWWKRRFWRQRSLGQRRHDCTPAPGELYSGIVRRHGRHNGVAACGGPVGGHRHGLPTSCEQGRKPPPSLPCFDGRRPGGGTDDSHSPRERGMRDWADGAEGRCGSVWCV